MAGVQSAVEQSGQVWQSGVLLRTKLHVPPVRADRVPRPGLIKRLNEGLTRKLCLVSAPAGFGKTTLLSEWIASARPVAATQVVAPYVPVAWLSLDEHDNDPARFATYFAAALEALEFNLGQGHPARPTFAALQPQVLEAVLTALINQITEFPEDFAFVLDDYHVITAQPIHDAMAFLLHHLPQQMHLVIASRVEPSLPLAQLRAHNQLTELRGTDLRFTLDEATAFFNQVMGLSLTGEMITALDARTEGWVAGLQLAALSMRDQKDLPDFIQAFTGSHHYIVDYLAEQVLQRQPADVQAFLLKTSILDRLTAPLCDAVTGQAQSQAMLEHLERANLFLVPLDDERRWYRYHRPFADFLRERLQQAQAGGAQGVVPDWSELHHRAAEWYERSSFGAEAVGHALAVGDNIQAVRLVEQIAEASWMRGEMMRLLGWLEALPDEMLRSRPRLCIFHAWILNIVGHFEAVQSRLRDAEQSLAQGADTLYAAEDQAVAWGMLATVRGIVAIMEGDATRAIELSQQALNDLPEANSVWRSVVRRNLGNAYLLTGQTLAANQAFTDAVAASQAANNPYMTLVSMYELAELHIVQGQLHQAARILREALQLAAERGSPGLTMSGALHVGLSDILREWNQLEAGTRHALAGIDLGQRGRSLGVQVCGYTRLGRLAWAQGDADGAADAFQKAARLAPVQRRTSFVAHHDAQAYLWGHQGDVAAAAHWVRQRGLHVDDEPTYMNEAAHITLARVLLLQGKPGEALPLVERLREAAQAAGRMGRVIEILVLQARILQAAGDATAALVALEQALCLAEPESYVRVFVDEGEPMRSLLQAITSQIEKRLQRANGDVPRRRLAYTNKLLSAFPDLRFQTAQSTPLRGSSTTPSLPSAMVEPLSERELEVLRLLASGLSNQQIAQKLFVAPSTAQWHIKNIYSKLDVHSRTQAVARARESSLLT